MAKIYVSPETLKKLSELNGSQNRINSLKAFDINRPEPKQYHSKVKNKTSTNETTSNKKASKPKQSKPTQIRRVTLNILKHPPKKSKKKKVARTKHLMGEITERRCSRSVGKPATFFYTPRRSSSKPMPNQNPGKKTPVSSKYMFDYSSPANEYESRQVEFGHGRTKSKEWNDEVAKKFQKEMKGTRRRKRDWTDRFALK